MVNHFLPTYIYPKLSQGRGNCIFQQYPFLHHPMAVVVCKNNSPCSGEGSIILPEPVESGATQGNKNFEAKGQTIAEESVYPQVIGRTVR